MLFDFRLRPLADVLPWGPTDAPCLHWFGLTDGWYRLNVGTDTLFEYTDAVSEQCGIAPSDEPYWRCVDYQVVRLWEDLLEILPHILEPIPEGVFRRVEPGWDALRWSDQVSALLFADSDEGDAQAESLDQVERATGWLNLRRLDVGYLQAGPRIWFWSDGESVHLRWDNRDLTIEGIPVWTATRGTITLPLPAFLEEVRSFDERLIQEMHERVQAVRAGRLPNVQIDVSQLLNEQQHRAGWLDHAFQRALDLPPTPWDKVVAAYDRWGQKGSDIRTHPPSQNAG